MPTGSVWVLIELCVSAACCVIKQTQQLLRRDNMTDKQKINPISKKPSTNYGPNESYQEATKSMGLEDDVCASHRNWSDSLAANGLTTGASSCTTLEENGRSYGTANFHGLTARKWCKARALVDVSPEARVTPSYQPNEWCGIGADELV
jgi:hypothetical protein